MKVEFEIPDSLMEIIEVEVSKKLFDKEWEELVVVVRSKDEMLADDFNELLAGMKKHGFELYALFGSDDGLELTFIKERGGGE